MIDDQIEVQELIQAMEDLLPIQAYATPSLSQSLRQRGTAIKANQAVQIDSVFNLGDEGGIACSIGKFKQTPSLFRSRTCGSTRAIRWRFESGRIKPTDRNESMHWSTDQDVRHKRNLLRS